LLPGKVARLAEVGYEIAEMPADSAGVPELGFILISQIDLTIVLGPRRKARYGISLQANPALVW
jgi:hypothetical protein